MPPTTKVVPHRQPRRADNNKNGASPLNRQSLLPSAAVMNPLIRARCVSVASRSKTGGPSCKNLWPPSPLLIIVDSPPSCRYITSGLYSPSIERSCVGPIVIAVDTPGSIGDEELRQFAGGSRRFPKKRSRERYMWCIGMQPSNSPRNFVRRSRSGWSQKVAAARISALPLLGSRRMS